MIRRLSWSPQRRSLLGAHAVSLFSMLATSLLLLAAPARADESGRGPVIFSRLCSNCHGDHGEGDQKLGAPAIAGLPQWYLESQLKKFRAMQRGAHPRDFAGMRMYPMATSLRTDEDLVSVATTVAALPSTSQPITVQGDATKGEALFQTCAACHGADASGNQQTSGPKLAGQSDWYLLAQLIKFKAAIRGGNSTEDPIGASMSALSQMLDENGQKDVVAYIASKFAVK